MSQSVSSVAVVIGALRVDGIVVFVITTISYVFHYGFIRNAC